MVVRIGRMHRYAVNASYFIVATRNRCLRPVEKAVIVTHFTREPEVERFWGQNFTQRMKATLTSVQSLQSIVA